MSRIKHLLIPIIVGLCIMSCIELQKAVTDASKISDPSSSVKKLSKDEIIKGLKEALAKGTDFAISKLS